jgi:hypothetical protein
VIALASTAAQCIPKDGTLPMLFTVSTMAVTVGTDPLDSPGSLGQPGAVDIYIAAAVRGGSKLLPRSDHSARSCHLADRRWTSAPHTVKHLPPVIPLLRAQRRRNFAGRYCQPSYWPAHPALGLTGDVGRVPLLPALLRPSRNTGSPARVGEGSGSLLSFKPGFLIDLEHGNDCML